jgi:radical SAM/Cys-rich protein
MNRFDLKLQQNGLTLRRAETRVLQLNIGRKCNQSCAHCHVNAGPARTEMMSRETMQRVLDWLQKTAISVVDITGGAPELNPHFRFLVEELRAQNRRVMDRCNLTILLEPGQENLGEFLAQNEVEVVASLPCYDFENVDAQRGEGVFEKSIRALQMLNALGYGRDEKQVLNLVYNPAGAFLPPEQSTLEATYKRKLHERFGIVFNRLFCLANLPVARFENYLKLSGKEQEYAALLESAFNAATIKNLMCRDTISVGWNGEVYDCDFNQMLNLQWQNGKPLFLWDIELNEVAGRAIETRKHCFGCTAGAGSSCSGALEVKEIYV